MRISDWSSDVCSSDLDPLKIGDLVRLARNFDRRGCRILRRHQQGRDQADQETDRNRAEDHIAPAHGDAQILAQYGRSEEHTSELQSLMRISYAVFCLKKKKKNKT